MWISNISAAGFRNLNISNQQLSSGVNILHGMNAQGKTSFLEAIYFCAFGRSLRAVSDKELIQFGQTAAHVRVDINRDGYTSLLDAHIEREGSKTKKGLALNHVPIKHMKDLFGRLLIVMFSPEDLRLIKAGPYERRRFMDMEICQLSPVYYSDLKEYYRALKQRNALLKILQKDKSQQDSLSIWDEQLANYGQRIMKLRSSFVKKINRIAKEVHSNITQGTENLTLAYEPSIVNIETYLTGLSKSHVRDIAQGTTTLGIHKDDVNFTINNISARFFGSQGQQRTAALSAKLAEIEIIKQSTNQTPILLLDDVLSELDGNRQQFLLEQIKNLQTLVTCTGLEDILLTMKDHKIMKMAEGRIK
ncbi:MAG: DNA replication/repair protein RecF [Firmicutes bacterium]|nr:DNA replication/repair protein RecF [Bacillota bacterium]